MTLPFRATKPCLDALKPLPRKGRKGHLYGVPIKTPQLTAEEEVRIIKRRVEKAERDERMDISNAVIPPKTYMGGFTKPRDLRASNWFPGGPYLIKGKKYESPHESAYEPHTVFLAETRYRVRFGVGRVNARDHVIGVVREKDWHKFVKHVNSARVGVDFKEGMDNACWPFIPGSGKVHRTIKWWDNNENPATLLKEIYEDPDYVDPPRDEKNLIEDDIEEPLPHQSPDQKKKSRALVDRFIVPREPGAKSNAARVFKLEEVRKAYYPFIKQEPFWRPLLAVTFSTRPLALTLSRLSKALERGLPFYASISDQDRKCYVSFDNRMRSLRVKRMRELTVEICKRLAGYKGGFIGIRFNTHSRGRGINGEGLEAPIPPEHRVVHVRVAKWYPPAEREVELYREGVSEWGGEDALRVSYINDWGQTLDENDQPLPWSETQTKELMDIEKDSDLILAGDVLHDEDLGELVGEEEEEEEDAEEEEDGFDNVDNKSNLKRNKVVEENAVEVTQEDAAATENESGKQVSEEKDEENMTDEELLRSPRRKGPVGMKKFRLKTPFHGGSPRAVELRKRLAYKLADSSKVLRIR